MAKKTKTKTSVTRQEIVVPGQRGGTITVVADPVASQLDLASPRAGDDCPCDPSCQPTPFRTFLRRCLSVAATGVVGAVAVQSLVLYFNEGSWHYGCVAAACGLGAWFFAHELDPIQN